jgi:hypothetical protein
MIEYTVRVHKDRTEWYLNGELHREDGPAIEWKDGSKAWHLNGQSHREDGPALEWANGEKQWYLNGNRHRTDGPAIEYTSGKKAWYLNGQEYTEQEFNQMTQYKELSVAEIEQLLGYKVKIVDK